MGRIIFASHTTGHSTALWNGHLEALTLAEFVANVDLCGSVEGVRSSRSEVFTSRTSKAN